MRFLMNEKETKKLVSLFNQHEKNIDYMLYLRDIIWQDLNINPLLFNDKNAFEKRSLFIDELLKEHPCDNEFIKKAIRWDTNLIDIKEFLNNPYLKALNNLSINVNGWAIKNKTMKAYTLFPYEEEYHYGDNATLKMNLGFFDHDYTYPTISLEDHEWMSLNPFEIRTMQIPLQLAKGKVLTLGLGLGYFAYVAHLKDEVKEVHIVEMDVDLIRVFNEYLLPLFPHPEKIHIHKADAFYYIETINDKDYDFIFSDLWHDVGDGLSSYLKLKQRFNSFSYTPKTYWIEGSIVTYLRTLAIGVLKNEYYQQESDYDEVQTLIKSNLKDYTIKNSYELDALLSIKGLNRLIFQ